MNVIARVLGLPNLRNVGLALVAGLLAAAWQPVAAAPVFVIGDGQSHAQGETVYFWGSQWWKNNPLSGDVDKGVASFKGYATEAACEETEAGFEATAWFSRPGNSSKPPQVLPPIINVVVTDSVYKDGPYISGPILQLLRVFPLSYGPAPGHLGVGRVVGDGNPLILCEGS